jgi:hypothetical protein
MDGVLPLAVMPSPALMYETVDFPSSSIIFIAVNCFGYSLTGDKDEVEHM